MSILVPLATRCWALLLVGVGLAASTTAAPEPSYPPPRSVGDPATLGRHLERTMTLLATSTPEHRHTVKVLFYGQSITEQEWWKDVANDLRRRFPNANLIIENRAIGGFASQLLVKTAETDLYSFYPDLMIFYVYGSHIEYENIIRRTCERTTAEILMQTDHATRPEDLTEETDPAKLTPKQWTPWMNYSFLPSTAAKYHCGLVDQHNLWKQYLKDTGLPPQQLLKDGVHLNAHGNYLMSELVKSYLIRRPDTTTDPFHCDTVKTYRVGSDLSWKDGRLRLEFDGNRVDVIASEGSAPPAPVLIDGRKPSSFPELYGRTRTTSFPGSIWPCLLLVTSEKAPVLEEWTLTIKDASPDLKSFKFDLVGSQTGPDGAGSGTENFVSKSGRVALNTNDWNFDYCLKVFKRPLPANFKVQWKIVPHFTDTYTSPALPDKTKETVVTLAQGLPKGRHTLEIQGSPSTPIAALRVYRPPLH